MFKGSMVAIVTPFKKGSLDEKALADLIEFQIKSGTDVIVPCGTTGESATLSHEEHHRVVEFTVRTVNKRVPVIAGAGSNSTEETLELTKFAKRSGADGVLLITPYYNKPTQEGLYQHFKKVAEAVDIPIVLYNVPGRTGVNMLPATVARLRAIKNIVGLKEATGDMKQVSEIIRLCGRDFDVISGDDFTTLPLLCLGGVGAISVTANVAPADCAACSMPFLPERGRRRSSYTTNWSLSMAPCSSRRTPFLPRHRLLSWARSQRNSDCRFVP